jgi:hypothetical protein
MALAAAQKQIGFAQQVDGNYRQLASLRFPDAWWSCAAAESWLARPVTEPPKPVHTCAKIVERPRLDGRLEEEFWRTAKPLELGTMQEGTAPAKVYLLHDDDFLYVAAECPKEKGVAYPAASGKRGYDSDLSANDRVEVYLDLDRDYATYYRLAFDHRGFTADQCWGDKSWNPTWYVAAAETDDSWTVEAAVPLAELCVERPKPRDAWAAGVQRIIPGHGLQSWNQPAALDVLPEGFGLLRFE